MKKLAGSKRYLQENALASCQLFHFISLISYRFSFCVEFDDFADAKLANADFDFAQIADDNPDNFAGTNEFHRGGGELRFGQVAQIGRVIRPVISGKIEIDLIYRR